MPIDNYNNNVFINCPFDNQYINLFRATVFTVLDAGFIPRCSLEIDDASQFRLVGIQNIISECRYGIHDLSRIKLSSVSNLPRFNMPFELGLFYSAKHFGINRQKKKNCIILEKRKYRYQRFISDLSGIDVNAHGNTQKKLIFSVRNWLVTASRRHTIPPGEDINKRFRTFQNGMRSTCNARSINYESMPFIELVDNMTDWLRLNQEDYIPIFSSS